MPRRAVASSIIPDRSPDSRLRSISASGFFCFSSAVKVPRVLMSDPALRCQQLPNYVRSATRTRTHTEHAAARCGLNEFMKTPGAIQATATGSQTR